ncbi:hypothetical protein ACXJY6_03240 [Vibrio sp. RC27]
MIGVAWMMISLLCVKLTIQVYKKSTRANEILPPIIGILVLAFTLISEDVRGTLYYPVGINISLLITFFLSLFYGQPIITKVAQITTTLDEAGLIYTRNLTKLWVVFFAVNGCIALITTQLSFEIWALYNGGISYVLIGSFISGEWIYRKRVLEK